MLLSVRACKRYNRSIGAKYMYEQNCTFDNINISISAIKWYINSFVPCFLVQIIEAKYVITNRCTDKVFGQKLFTHQHFSHVGKSILIIEFLLET